MSALYAYSHIYVKEHQWVELAAHQRARAKPCRPFGPALLADS